MQDAAYIPGTRSENRGRANSIPVGILNNENLSALETTTKYLKENLDMRFCDIAKALNRDESTIWDAYKNSTEKSPGYLEYSSEIEIPLAIIGNRRLSTLESIICYLKDVLGMKYCDIARLIGRNDRTVWTCYQRSRKKRAQC